MDKPSGSPNSDPTKPTLRPRLNISSLGLVVILLLLIAFVAFNMFGQNGF